LGSLALLVGMAAARPPEEPAGAARPITYADLGKWVRGHKGKVVVVDFWSVT
jgi:hypothetical protein